jgi:hypothetical protein
MLLSHPYEPMWLTHSQPTCQDFLGAPDATVRRSGPIAIAVRECWRLPARVGFGTTNLVWRTLIRAKSPIPLLLRSCWPCPVLPSCTYWPWARLSVVISDSLHEMRGPLCRPFAEWYRKNGGVARVVTNLAACCISCSRTPRLSCPAWHLRATLVIR